MAVSLLSPETSGALGLTKHGEPWSPRDLTNSENFSLLVRTVDSFSLIVRTFSLLVRMVDSFSLIVRTVETLITNENELIGIN